MIRTNTLLTSSQNIPWWKLISIEPVVFLYTLAIYTNIPTNEALLYREICSKLYNLSLCNSMNVMKINQTNIYETMEDIIQKSSSIYIIYFNFVYSIPSIFISMIYNIWLDKYSHKIPLILGNISCILAAIINFLILKLNISIEIFFLSNIFLNLFGSTSLMFSIIYNYLLHITTIETRRERFAIIESCLMFGSTLGLILSGILFDLINFLFLIFIHLINIIYIIVYIKEVISIEEKLFSWKYFYENLVIWIKDSVRIIFKKRKFNQRKYLLLVLIGLFGSESSIVYLYLKKSPLSFSQSLYGIFRGLKSFSLGLGLLLILPILRYLFDISDMTCAILGILSKCASDFLYAINHSTMIIFLIPISGMLSSYVIVGVRSYISKICNHDEEGKIFSIIASLESIDGLIGSILFNILYSYTISIYPSLIFILACFLHFLTLPIFIYILFNDDHLNRRKIVIKPMKKISINKNFYFRDRFRNNRKFLYKYNRLNNVKNPIRYI